MHAAGGGTEPLRVIVDGVDVGPTPWEGDLPPGSHQIGGRNSSSSAVPQSIDVAAGSRTAVDLTASPNLAHLQVRTSDGKGTIFIDGASRGEGVFSGDVQPGPHSVVVTREGYERFERTMPLAERQTWAETVTLQPVAGNSGSPDAAERAFEGIYGGFGFMAGFGVGGQGSELETNCATLGATSCDTPSPVGGGAFGYVGWTWNPVGFELFLAGFGDANKQTAHFTGQSVPSQLPASTPARSEAFQFVRGGGLAALRVRASFQNRLLRASVAGGLGLAYRQMFMKRDATAADGSGQTATFVPDGVGYYSPAISISGEGQIRMSPTLALAVGVQLWADSASIGGSNSSPAPSQQQFLGATPIPTPAYHLATGPQVFLLPYLGMQFGP